MASSPKRLVKSPPERSPDMNHLHSARNCELSPPRVGPTEASPNHACLAISSPQVWSVRGATFPHTPGHLLWKKERVQSVMHTELRGAWYAELPRYQCALRQTSNPSENKNTRCAHLETRSRPRPAGLINAATKGALYKIACVHACMSRK